MAQSQVSLLILLANSEQIAHDSLFAISNTKFNPARQLIALMNCRKRTLSQLLDRRLSNLRQSQGNHGQIDPSGRRIPPPNQIPRSDRQSLFRSAASRRCRADRLLPPPPTLLSSSPITQSSAGSPARLRAHPFLDGFPHPRTTERPGPGSAGGAEQARPPGGGPEAFPPLAGGGLPGMTPAWRPRHGAAGESIH